MCATQVEDLEKTFRDAQRAIVDQIRQGADDDDDGATGTARDGPSEPTEIVAPSSRLARLWAWVAYLVASRETFLPLVKTFLAMQRVRLANRLAYARHPVARLAALPRGDTTRSTPRAPPFDARLVCDRLVYAVGRCVLIDGIFSADPHPGNVVVRDGNEISLIDMGCVYRLKDGERRDLALALRAIKHGNTLAIGQLWEKISGFKTKAGDYRAYAALCIFALSHFEFGPIIGTEPLLKTLQRPEHKPSRAIQAHWLPMVQRCTEILRGNMAELGIAGVRLCDAWSDLAEECLETTRDADTLHRVWPGGQDVKTKRSDLYRGRNPSITRSMVDLAEAQEREERRC